MIFFRYGLHDQFLFLMTERIELAIGSQAEQRRRACRDLAVSGDTVYGFAADGHMMILPASQGKAESYRLNITVDQVYGVTRDHVAVLGSGDSIYLVNLE